jgi:hypothetical protein
LAEELALAKVEYFSLTFFHPHWGHGGEDCFGQAYSKIGIEEGGYSLPSGSHEFLLVFPDGD